MTPTKKTKALCDEIIRRLSDGETLRSICRLDGFPHFSTFHDWRHADPELDKQYVAAKQAGYDAIADDCLDIADNGTNDYTADVDGNQVLDRDHIQRSKLRVDTRLKLLAKWYPAKYGDKLALEHSTTDSLAERLKAARERGNSD